MKSLTKDELNRLLKAAEENPNHWLAIIVSYTHGLRASELTEMTASQIREGYLTVIRKKGSLPTIQALIGPEKEPLETLAASVHPQDRLFKFTPRWFQMLMHKYGEKAGIPYHKSTPHKLKHTCAMMALAGGIKLNALQKHLGHKSLSSTGAYLVISQDQATEEFAKAVGLST
jgi:integrase